MKPSRLGVRPMRERHVDEMLRIEQSSRENFWNKESFVRHLRAANHAGLVVLEGETNLAGFIAYEHIGRYAHVLNLVVGRRFRKRGVAHLLLDSLKEMVPTQSDGIRFNVRESNLPVQLLLRKASFWCDHIAPEYFIDRMEYNVRVEDAYCFDYNPTKSRKNNVQVHTSDGFGADVAVSRSG